MSDAKTTDADVELLRQEAAARPEDVLAQIAAAYACDTAGLEAEAIGYYDAAWNLGVPAEERANFLIGYGSTLKNAGRFEESERVLRQAILEGPFAGAARAFLALTLNEARRSNEAVAELVELLLEEATTRDAGLKRYERALNGYARDLRARCPLDPPPKP